MFIPELLIHILIWPVFLLLTQNHSTRLSPIENQPAQYPREWSAIHGKDSCFMIDSALVLCPLTDSSTPLLSIYSTRRLDCHNHSPPPKKKYRHNLSIRFYLLLQASPSPLFCDADFKRSLSHQVSHLSVSNIRGTTADYTDTRR